MGDTEQAIEARIAELLESGPVPREELAAAVAISPDEREGIADWEATVLSVADEMERAGKIDREGGADAPRYVWSDSR